MNSVFSDVSFNLFVNSVMEAIPKCMVKEISWLECCM